MTDKDRIKAHIQNRYKPFEVFEKWGVMEHFANVFGEDKIAQPTTERRLRELWDNNEGFLRHPEADLFDNTKDKYYYTGGIGDATPNRTIRASDLSGAQD